MHEPPAERRWIWALGLLVLLAVGWRLAGSRPPEPSAAPAPIRVADEAGAQSGGRVLVHVAGAVREPGVYRLHAGDRVEEAVERAGGFAPRADRSAINLAAKVEDGRQILVPARARAAPAGSAAALGPTAPPGVAGPINLNTATAEQLDALDGLGPETVRKILEYRDAHDGFGSVDELAQIPGIGEKRLATLRSQVTL